MVPARIRIRRDYWRCYQILYKKSFQSIDGGMKGGGKGKIFTSGVNFFRNNAIYNISESIKYISKTVDRLKISSSITKECTNY